MCTYVNIHVCYILTFLYFDFLLGQQCVPMPSRAVLRKKARRESKRRKDETEGKTTAFKLQAMEQLGKSHKADATKHVASDRKVQCNKRPRGETVKEKDTDVCEVLEGASRKERKRFEAKRRFERQLGALNRSLAAVTSNTDGTSGDAAPSAEEAHQRHDPKYKNGTFWRDRKERRRRTVFLGNVPAKLTEQDVTSLISDTLRKGWTPPEEDGIADVDVVTEEEVVESVDFIKSMPRAKRRHMYVTMCSIKAAESATKLLDGKMMEGIALRCNFAADKVQRGEAIQRRSASGSEH